MKINLIISFFSLMLILSCSVEPKPIVYNEDQCSACKMMIADSRFGSELVTKKGKIYKYDAIECLVSDVVLNGSEKYAFMMVSDYLNPGTLVSVKEAKFLIHKDRPSPMGANLSAYLAEDQQISKSPPFDAKLMSWDELLEHSKN